MAVCLAPRFDLLHEKIDGSLRLSTAVGFLIPGPNRIHLSDGGGSIDGDCRIFSSTPAESAILAVMGKKTCRTPSIDDLRRSAALVFAYERIPSLVLACALLGYLLWLGIEWLWGRL